MSYFSVFLSGIIQNSSKGWTRDSYEEILFWGKIKKLYDDTLTHEFSVCEGRHLLSTVIQVLAVVFFGRLVPKLRYGTMCSILTPGYDRLLLFKTCMK